MSHLAIALCLALLAAPAIASQPSIWVDSVNGAPPPNASGSPEEMSPVAALATCHTNGAASTTIQWAANGITLPAGNTCSGADNCGVLFLNTGAGRQYTEILSVTADTVVVEDSFNIAAVSAVDCAVGGRITNVSPQLALDMKSDHASPTHGNAAGGWQVFLVASGVNYTWTAERAMTAGNGGGFYGVLDGSTRPIVDCSFQPGNCISLGGTAVRGIEFRNTNATKTGTVGLLLGSTGSNLIENVIVGGDTAATAFAVGISWTNNQRFIVGSLIRNNVLGLSMTGANSATYFVLSTVFQDNGQGIVNPVSGLQSPALVLLGNIFWGTTAEALVIAHPTAAGGGGGFPQKTILFNTFHANDTGVLLSTTSSLGGLVLASNLFTSNTVGVSYTAAARNIERETTLADFNCYGLGPVANGANVGGTFSLGPNTINVNPLYVDAAGGDFTPQNQDAAFIAWPPGLDGLSPRFFPGTATPSEPRCGAIQPGSGGGGFTNVGI